MSILLNSADKEIFLMIVLNDIICEMMSFYILSIINMIDIDVLTYLKVSQYFVNILTTTFMTESLYILNVINALETDIKIYLIIIITTLL